MSDRVVAIIVAAGSATRFGADKLSVEIGGCSVLERTLRAFAGCAAVDAIVVVTKAHNGAAIRSWHIDKLEKVVDGGATRAQSVANGVAAAGDCGWLCIHDGARPLVTPQLIERTVAAAKEHGAAAPVLACTDSLKTVEDGFIVRNVERASTFAVQTPQVFAAAAYRRAVSLADGSETDDCAVAEKVGLKVFAVTADADNIKITGPNDIEKARHILGLDCPRVGYGYDVHRLVSGRPLILCGVTVPYEKGLLGHSDADVAAHALIDALFGAAACGDIGSHFPDSDERYRGADSLGLLRTAMTEIRADGYELVNADVTIVAQAPKLRPYIEQMRAGLAAATDCALDQVGVKATTEEKLGFTGSGAGMSAYAAVMLRRR